MSSEQEEEYFVVELDSFLKLYEEMESYRVTSPSIVKHYASTYKGWKKSPLDTVENYYKIVKIVLEILEDKWDITPEEQDFLDENDIDGIIFTGEQYKFLQKLLKSIEDMQDELAKHNITLMVN
jgi:hypothetical protein